MLSRRKYIRLVISITLYCSAWVVHSQTIDLTVDLATPTNTPEAAVNAALADICSRLSGQSGLPPDTQDLVSICTLLTDNDLDFNVRLRALRAVSSKASSAETNLSTRTPFGWNGDSIGRRIAALQRGATGFSLADLQLQIEHKIIPADALLPQRGGAAGDALGSEFTTRWGGFLSGNLAFGSQDETPTEEGFDANSQLLVAGVDYRPDDRHFVGAALGIASNDVDLLDSRGSLEGLGYNVTLFGAFFPAQKWYLEGTAHIGQGDYDLTREINFTASSTTVNRTGNSSTQSSQLGFSATLGTEYLLTNGALADFTAMLNVSSADIESFDESNAAGLNLHIEDQSIDTRSLHFAVDLRKAFSQRWGVITPNATAVMVYELETGGQDIAAHFLADPGAARFSYPTANRDDMYFAFSLGTSMTYAKGASSFLQVTNLMGLENYEQITFSWGYRRELP